MTADTWPTDRPGYPLRAERDGWHWIATLPNIVPTPWRWWPDSESDGGGDWRPPGSRWATPLRNMQRYHYLGPCYTQADLDAAVQAEREVCAEIAHETELQNAEAQRRHAVFDVEAAIRARGHDDALADAKKAAYREGWNDRESDFLAGVDRTGMVVVSAEALAQARREGMEEAARIAHAAHGEEGACHETIRMVERAIRSAAAGEEGK